MTGACFMQLVAQAEAEKRNIGQADYIHREYDHAKKVQEEKEKHRIEINKYASCDLCTKNTQDNIGNLITAGLVHPFTNPTLPTFWVLSELFISYFIRYALHARSAAQSSPYTNSLRRCLKGHDTLLQASGTRPSGLAKETTWTE